MRLGGENCYFLVGELSAVFDKVLRLLWGKCVELCAGDCVFGRVSDDSGDFHWLTMPLSGELLSGGGGNLLVSDDQLFG